MSEAEEVRDGQIELIKHLSSEITTQAEYLGTLRARMGLTFIVGPFVVFGSFLLATKGVQLQPFFWEGHLTSIFVASGSYLALGLYAAMLDKQVTDQCDRWRRTIFKLSKNQDVGEGDVLFRHRTFFAYMIGWLLTFIAFTSIVWLLFSILPQGGGSATPKG
jgi:hypothetical protein